MQEDKEKRAKELIEAIKPYQTGKEYLKSCPRCGIGEIIPDGVSNAKSRYADIYICSECGRAEALRELCGSAPLPFRQWAAVQVYFGEIKGESK